MATNRADFLARYGLDMSGNTPQNTGGTTSYTLSNSGKPSDKAARVTRAQWERYQQLYTPVENRLIGSIGQDMTRPAMRDARQADTLANQMTDRMKSRMGLTDLPGAPVQANRQRQRQLAQSEAYNNASLSQVDRNQNIRGSLVDVGQGIVNQATGGLTDASGMQAGREAAYSNAKAQHDQAKTAQRNSTIGTVASMGAMALMGGF